MKTPDFNKASARKAVSWAQRVLGITDWKIDIAIQDEPPEWTKNANCGPPTELTAGMCWNERKHKLARIWVRLELPAASETFNPWVTLFHEVLHTMEADIIPLPETSGQFEYSWTAIATLMAKAYLAGIK